MELQRETSVVSLSFPGWGIIFSLTVCALECLVPVEDTDPEPVVHSPISQAVNGTHATDY